MIPYWLQFDFIDPALGLNSDQRRLVRRRARELSRRFRIGLKAFDLFPLLVALCVTFAPLMLMMSGMWMPRTPSSALVSFTLFGFAGWLLGAFLTRWGRRRWINQALRDLGHHVCLHCGYWLRGLGDDVKSCPECGAKREPMSAPSEQVAWVERSETHHSGESPRKTEEC